jgi:hypothetical protein
MKFLFLIPYITAMAVCSLCLGVMYVSVQQNFRSNANDPQLQLATDIRNSLELGQSPEKWLPGNIDLSGSLSPFVTFYDKNLQPVQSTGFLEGKFPLLPKGIFDFVNQHGEERVSWQPRRDIRMAMIVLAVKAPDIGFVAVGRSLKEVEIRESNLLNMVFVGWLLAMGLIALAAFIRFKYNYH